MACCRMFAPHVEAQMYQYINQNIERYFELCLNRVVLNLSIYPPVVLLTKVN